MESWVVQELPSAAVLRDACDQMTSRAKGVLDAVTGVKDTWGGLGAVFSVSGTETVSVAMSGPELTAALFQENVERGRKALDYLADEYEALSRRRVLLVERVEVMQARLATVAADTSSSQYSTEFGMVAESDQLDAQADADALLADIAKFHADIVAAEDVFAADLARGITEDVLPTIDGLGTFTDRVTRWAEPGELGSAMDYLDVLVADSVTDRLDWLLTVSEQKAKDWLDDNPDFWDAAELADPVAVSDWWDGLTSQSEGVPGAWESGPAAALIALSPAMLGSLNGIPAKDRVAANRAATTDWIADAKKDLADEEINQWRTAFLEQEIAYLERAAAGEVQLYLYDRDKSRIIEMIGTPTVDTERVITFVPGTFTSGKTFFSGSAQQLMKFIVDEAPGTVAFAYKDGLFPGENQESGGMSPYRIGEANEEERALIAGERLASFEEGMRTDALLGGREQTAVGFSWGLANVTSSEVAGTDYDKVISLSGAGMPPAWTANPNTAYTDFAYYDFLQAAQHADLVWEGKNPRTDPAFEHGDYYVGPNDETYQDADVNSDDFDALMANHDLIIQNSKANDAALKDILAAVIK